MQRITIIYRGESDARFDWEHYINKHLPLAVGTSRRYSSLNKCDMDKPLDFSGQGFFNPHVCICVVYFADEQGMSDFRQFFATEHPDSLEIIKDEPNYTEIMPDFVASHYERHEYQDRTTDAMVRIRFLWPAIGGIQVDKAAVQEVINEFNHTEKETGQLHAVEVDICTAGVMPDSEPTYSVLWSLYLQTVDTETLDVVNKLNMQNCIEKLNEQLQAQPEVMISDLLEFDLKNSDAYL